MAPAWRKHKSEPCFSVVRPASDVQGMERARAIIAAAFDEGKKDVDLSALGLSQLPVEISDLKHFISVTRQHQGAPGVMARTNSELQLFLSNNKIASLPKSLFELKNLSVLTLRSNQLKVIPQDICNLADLQELQLSGNRLEWLPVEIKQLTKLRTLAVSPHSLAKKTSVTRVGAGPLTLLEAAARSILETEGQRALAGSDVPLELKTILSKHKRCSHCRGPFIDQYIRVVTFDKVAGLDVPLAHHLCSERCCGAVLTPTAAEPQASGGA